VRSTLALLVAGALCVASSSATQAQRTGFFPNVSLQLQPSDGSAGFVVSATSYKAPFTVDFSKLSFFVRPNGSPQSAGRPLKARIGSAAVVSTNLAHAPVDPVITGFRAPVAFPDPPDDGATYDISATARTGFAQTPTGELPLGNVGIGGLNATPIWWASKTLGAASLRRLRHTYEGRTVYGYGGIAVSCAPDWTRFYPATTPIRVRSIRREHTVTWLGTGHASYPYVGGLGFIAWNPVRVVFSPTDATPSGTNYRVGGAAGDCPALLLADWQAESVLSTSPPPSSIPTVASPEVKVGMSRDQVAWIRGYPNEMGDRATLRKEVAWRYGTMPMNSSTITFNGDRVASVVSAR
jgi:hypothetical protein